MWRLTSESLSFGEILDQLRSDLAARTISVASRALCAAIIAAVMINDAALAADYELLSAVIVSRHGVRSPTAVTPPLASIAADPWPRWPVPPGYLTPRGAPPARPRATDNSHTS